MADTIDVDFTTRAGTPTVIEVVGHDGNKYEIRVVVAVVSIRDEQVMQESPYGLIPKLQVQFQLAIDTRPQGASPALPTSGFGGGVQ